MVLGDFFPQENRLETFLRQFRAGRIFLLSCDFTTPPKEKFLLLAAAIPKPLFLVINSDINDFIRARQHMLDRQVPIHAADHEFLNHNSYIDCTNVISSLSIEDVQGQVLANMQRIKGMVDEPTVAAVVYAIRAARTVEVRHKLPILAELEPRPST